MTSRRRGLLYTILTLSIEAASCDRSLSTCTHAAWKFVRSRVPNGLLKSTSALNTRRGLRGTDLALTQEVATKKKKRKQKRRKFKLPSRPDLPQEMVEGLGLYYGLTPKSVSHSAESQASPQPQRLALKDTMALTLDEVRSMRKEMEALRRELSAIKRGITGEEEATVENSEQTLLARRTRQQNFERLGKEVEAWAESLLFGEESEASDWEEVKCNRMFRGSFNSDGRTKAYLKWMKDSRGDVSEKEDRKYPCIRVFSTVDAPLECVCAYLSQEKRMPEYNDLVVKNRDLEDVTPHSKICWGQTPQILFIKPRNLVTFCHHRWRRDGSQVVVNQACDFDGVEASAFALRGASFIGRDPDDPEKTRLAILAHANPGDDIPKWACKTAVNTVAPIEPFKLFHKINEGVKQARKELERDLQDTEMVGVAGRSTRPAGLSQMGYACFWPNGGGEMENATDDTVNAENMVSDGEGNSLEAEAIE